MTVGAFALKSRGLEGAGSFELVTQPGRSLARSIRSAAGTTDAGARPFAWALPINKANRRITSPARDLKVAFDLSIGNSPVLYTRSNQSDIQINPTFGIENLNDFGNLGA